MDLRHRLPVALVALSILPATAPAEALVTGLAGDARPGTALPADGPGSPVVFHANPGFARAAEGKGGAPAPASTTGLLTTTLAVPAGTTPASSDTTGNSLVKPPSAAGVGDPGGGTPGDPGDPGSGKLPLLVPEPGSLAAALAGAALIGLGAWRRGTWGKWGYGLAGLSRRVD
jgi:hypothetical protein